MIADHGVVQLEAEVEPALRRPAAALVEVAVARIEQERIVGRVQLDVGRAELDQLVDLLAQDRGHVLQERLERRVRLARALRVVEVREQARAGERHLEDAVGAPARVRELLAGERAPAAQRSHHRDRRALDDHVAQLLRVPLAPEKRVEVPLAEAIHGGRHLALEGEPAHLAVGDHVETGVRLQREGRVDGAVLDRLELRAGEAAGRQALLRLQQLGRPEQAADHVGSSFEHAGRL